MKYVYVITTLTANTMRGLQRIVGVFTRHGLHIEQMSIFETNLHGLTYFNIVMQCDEIMAEKLLRQLQRIVELMEVKFSCSK